MQPAAHYSAAIEILDQVLTNVPAEKALLAWVRNARFAGSKDRAAIRDIVFDCLRKRSSYAARFDLTGRGLALGRAYEAGELLLFDGENYAPPVLSEEEIAMAAGGVQYKNLAEEYDFPEFLEIELQEQYGYQLAPLMEKMRDRAPVDLRVNEMKATREKAIDFLARDHIFTENLPEPSALRVEHNPRRLASSRAYNYGFVELQDQSSQMVSRFADARPGQKVLDYCAGGGGKALALAMDMKGDGTVDAWDIAPQRMKEIPERAVRAGVRINILTDKPRGEYDLVLVDAPCSGSGAWRRTPDSKWKLTRKRLGELNLMQIGVLQEASARVKQGASLVYATCSLLASENQSIVSQFLAKNPEFECLEQIELNPLNAGDGFFAAKLRRKAS